MLYREHRNPFLAITKGQNSYRSIALVLLLLPGMEFARSHHPSAEKNAEMSPPLRFPALLSCCAGHYNKGAGKKQGCSLAKTIFRVFACRKELLRLFNRDN